MKMEEFLKKFLCANPEYKDEDFLDAWAFGEDSDRLADLVLRGIKRATSSAYIFYDFMDEEVPKVGDLSIILNSFKESLSIIKTKEVKILPFNQVGEDFAYLEGEGDRSLAYWRAVHRDFFEREYKKQGLVFKEDDLIVCEVFEKIYPRNDFGTCY